MKQMYLGGWKKCSRILTLFFQLMGSVITDCCGSSVWTQNHGSDSGLAPILIEFTRFFQNLHQHPSNQKYIYTWWILNFFSFLKSYQSEKPENRVYVLRGHGLPPSSEKTWSGFSQKSRLGPRSDVHQPRDRLDCPVDGLYSERYRNLLARG